MKMNRMHRRRYPYSKLAIWSCLAVIGIVIVLVLSGVDTSFSARRKIGGDFRLTQWEDNQTYYLDDVTDTSAGNSGAIEGTIILIGWDRDFIVVKRRPMYQPNPDDWVTVDIHTKTVSKSLSETDTIKKPEFNKIEFFKPEVAWKKLCGFPYVCW